MKPSPKLPFIYFGAIGTDDFNYPEMCALKKSLAENQILHRVETFAGGHDWLSDETAETALRWLKLQAMKAGSLEKDEKFIDESFAIRGAEVEGKISSNQILDAFRASRAVIQDFKGWRETSRFEEYVRGIESSKELNKSIQTETEQFRRQQNIADELKTLTAKLRDTEDKLLIRQEIKRFVENLRKTADSPADDAERRVARRALGQVFAENFETAVSRLRPQKLFEAAIVSLETAVEICPQAIGAWFELARCYAAGQKKAALKALEEAVSRGFQNAALLESVKEFSAIRQTEQFKSAPLSTNGNAASFGI